MKKVKLPAVTINAVIMPCVDCVMVSGIVTVSMDLQEMDKCVLEVSKISFFIW